MGLLDNLKNVVEGSIDIATAPFGLAYDIARSFPDSDFTLGDAGQNFTQRFVGGLAQAGGPGGLNLQDAASGLGSIPYAGDAVSNIFNQLELIYNPQRQREQQEAPFGLQNLGVSPGAVSIGGTLSSALGGAATLLPGGEPAIDFFKAVQRGSYTSPGRAVIDNTFGVYSMSRPEREAFQSSFGYNLVTGAIDATARWYSQPEILGGKALGKIRRNYLSVEHRLTKALKNGRVRLEKLDDIEEAFSHTLRTDEPAYMALTVDDYLRLVNDGNLSVGDELDDVARILREDKELTEGFNLGVASKVGDETVDVSRLETSLDRPTVESFFSQTVGMSLSDIEQMAASGQLTPEILQQIIDALPAVVGQDVPALDLLLASPVIQRAIQHGTVSRVGGILNSRGMSGVQASERANRFRRVFFGDDLDELQRYSVQVQQEHGKRMVFLEIDGNGLKVLDNGFTDTRTLDDIGALTDTKLLEGRVKAVHYGDDEFMRPYLLQEGLQPDTPAYRRRFLLDQEWDNVLIDNETGEVIAALNVGGNIRFPSTGQTSEALVEAIARNPKWSRVLRPNASLDDLIDEHPYLQWWASLGDTPQTRERVKLAISQMGPDDEILVFHRGRPGSIADFAEEGISLEAKALVPTSRKFHEDSENLGTFVSAFPSDVHGSQAPTVVFKVRLRDLDHPGNAPAHLNPEDLLSSNWGMVLKRNISPQEILVVSLGGEDPARVAYNLYEDLIERGRLTHIWRPRTGEGESFIGWDVIGTSDDPLGTLSLGYIASATERGLPQSNVKQYLDELARAHEQPYYNYSARRAGDSGVLRGRQVNVPPRTPDDVGARQVDVAARANVDLWNPDGTARHPNQILDENAPAVLQTAKAAYAEDPDAGLRYLRGYQLSQDQPSYTRNLVNNILGDRKVQKLINWMDGKDADAIRRRLFPEHQFGSVISSMLADADTVSEKYAILAAIMGIATPEAALLKGRTAERIAALTKDFMISASPNREALREASRFTFAGMYDDLDNVAIRDFEQWQRVVFDEMAVLRQDARFADFLHHAHRVFPAQEIPRLTAGGAVREGIRRSSWYQNGHPLTGAKAVRSAVEKHPRQFVNLRDGKADIHLVRQMEAARSLGVTGEEVARFRNQIMAAMAENNEAKIIQILNQADEFILNKAAKEAGLTRNQVNKAVSRLREGKSQMNRVLGSRRYSPVDGADIIRYKDPDTGETVEMILPILASQLSQWAPMQNVSELVRVTRIAKRYRDDATSAADKFMRTYRGKDFSEAKLTTAGDLPKEFMDTFYAAWKPSVLLRGGWPIRVVTDEQFRILGVGRSMIRHLASIDAGPQMRFTKLWGRKAGEQSLTGGERLAQLGGIATGTVPLTAGGVKLARASRASKLLQKYDPEYWDDLVEAGVEPLVSARASFAGPNEDLLQSYASLLGTQEGTFIDRFTSLGSGQWVTVGKESPQYGVAWRRVLNDQFREDDLVRVGANIIRQRVASGGTLEEARNAAHQAMRQWLNTSDGRAYSAQIPWRAQHPDRWVDDVLDTLEHYTVDFEPALIGRIADGKSISLDVLEKIDEARRPATIHAEVINQALGKGKAQQFVNDFLSEAFDVTGRMPTDTLSRQPFFRQMYANNMKALRANLRRQNIEITPEILKDMQASSRTFAIGQVQKYLYDLAEVSRFGHMSRFFFPFFQAWQEILTVWTGIAIHNPAIIGKARLLWSAPNKAGLVVKDDNGEEFIRFQLPEGVVNTAGELFGDWGRYMAEGGVQFGKGSFNMVLNNPLPGAGPIVQVPVNEVLKTKPELEEALTWIMPFGPRERTSDIFLSPGLRAITSLFTGPGSDSRYRRDYVDAMSWLDYRYRAGLSTIPPTQAQVEEIAQKLYIARSMASLVSPVTPMFQSPLAPYTEIYRDMVEAEGGDSNAATEKFLNQYGEEFFAVTLGRTVSKTGIPPTVEAEVARRDFDTLIQKYPEYGRLIIGEAAGLGEFSRAAFIAQLSRDVGEGSDRGEERSRREFYLDPRTGRVEEIDRRLGWRQYIRAMDAIEALRKARGLPNLRVKEARRLRAVKTAVTQQLAQQYPTWWDDFNTRDELKWQKRVNAFRDIATSSLVDDIDRPDMEGVRQYMAVREVILQELNRRKQLGRPSTLQAAANADLLSLWEAVIGQILSRNLAFHDIYFRYLEGDPVELRTANAA